MAKRKKIAVIDCETDPFKEGRIPQPFIWGFYTPETGILYFDNAKELMDFLADENYRVYAHNGGKFDFHYLLDFIPDWQKVTMIGNRLAEFKYKGSTFCDSYCILPVPLSSYQKTEISYDIFEAGEREKPENMRLIKDYLKDDCVFLYELVIAFIEEYGTHLTIASAAMKKLQKMLSVKVENSGKAFFDTIRPYYYGGRVQCFEKGIIKGGVHCFDINSAYPRAMLEHHPIGDAITMHSKKPEILGHNFYKIAAISKGALPFRDEEMRLTFPCDNEKRVYCVTGWELQKAIKLNLVSHIQHIEQKLFMQQISFTEYVNYFYTLKATSAKNSPEYIFAKLFLNSAYGKFAANPEKYKELRIIPLEDWQSAFEQGYAISEEIHGRLIITRDNDEETHRYYNIATGASITGWVRAYLLEALHSVEKPIYCDTDSVTFQGEHSLIEGKDIGQWKDEGFFDLCGIGGKKIYAMKNKKTGETKTACKGLALEYEDILRVCKGEIIERLPITPIFSIKKGKYFLKKTIAMT